MSTAPLPVLPHDEPDADRSRIARLTFYFGLAYFCQGISQVACLINQPLRYYLRQGNGYDADRISHFIFICTIPWMIKPLYGLVSDFIPLLGYRRKTWLLLMNFLATGAFLYVMGITKVEHVLFALTITGVGVAAADVIVDALMVEAGQETGKVGVFQGVQWVCINVAAIGASFLGGWICGKWNPQGALRVAALISAGPPLVVAALTWWAVRERKSTMDLPQLKETGRGLLAAFTSGRLWAVAGFLILINIDPALVTPMYRHLTDHVGLDEAFFGRMDGVSAIGQTIGSAIFLLWMARHLSTRSSLAVGLIALAVMTIPYLFIRGPKSAYWASAVWGVGYMMASLASMSLAALACPKRAEGFVFAAMMSIVNLARQFSDKLGGHGYVHWTDRDIRPLILVTIGSTLLGLLIVPFLPAMKREQASS